MKQSKIDQLPVFKAAVESFVGYLLAERNFSPATAKNYRSDLVQFSVYLVAQALPLDPARLQPDHVNAWLAWCKNESGHSLAIRNRRVSALRHFFKYLAEKKIIAANPMQALRSGKRPKSLPKPIPEQQLRQLLQAPDPATAEGARDQAAMEIMYGSGLRISELCGLNRRDFDLGNPAGPNVRVVGKGGKTRLIPLSRTSVEKLSAYQLRTGPDPQNNGPVFFGNRGGRLNPRALQLNLKKYLAGAGLDTSFTPHQLRHSFGTHLLDHGADIRVIQELMGHDSLTSTQVYTQVSQAKAAEDYKRSHPRDNWEVTAPCR